MGFRFQAPKFSPCELDYLKLHLEDPIMQLAGYLGKSANAIKNKVKEIKTGVVPTKKRSIKGTKIGKRADLGLFVRSGWEANVLRWLTHTGLAYQYEPTTFSFIEHGVKHGTVSYTPDIYIPFSQRYIEVKGFLKTEDKTKLRRFKKYYPEEFKKLTAVVGSKTNKTGEFFINLGVPIIAEYNRLNKEYKNIIPGWE